MTCYPKLMIKFSSLICPLGDKHMLKQIYTEHFCLSVSDTTSYKVKTVEIMSYQRGTRIVGLCSYN